MSQVKLTFDEAADATVARMRAQLKPLVVDQATAETVSNIGMEDSGRTMPQRADYTHARRHALNHDQDEYRSVIRSLKQRWDTEDAARDNLERQLKEKFLEEYANQIFARIEDFLAKLDKVLHDVGASVTINQQWEDHGTGVLRRLVKVNSTNPTRQLSLAFTIQGTSISYLYRSYHFQRDAEALIRAIAHEVEQFFGRR